MHTSYVVAFGIVLSIGLSWWSIYKDTISTSTTRTLVPALPDTVYRSVHHSVTDKQNYAQHTPGTQASFSYLTFASGAAVGSTCCIIIILLAVSYILYKVDSQIIYGLMQVPGMLGLITQPTLPQ